MAEDGLTDEQWATIQPLIPRQVGRDRGTLNAILYVTSTGCRWENLKKTDYSHHYTTAWRRLKRWKEEGTWKRILDALIPKGYSLGIVKMNELSIDSSRMPAKRGESRLPLMVTNTSRGRSQRAQAGSHNIRQTPAGLHGVRSSGVHHGLP